MEKRVEESQTEQTHLLMPQHINGSGRLFGGQLLAWIDETAGIVGRRHSGRDVVTAAIDNLQFKAGAYRNEIIVLIGRVTYTGRTSMEVRVDTYVESPDGMRRPINRAAEWEGAVKRKELHKKRRTEGF